jgi:hypothetical protein
VLVEDLPFKFVQSIYTIIVLLRALLADLIFENFDDGETGGFVAELKAG